MSYRADDRVGVFFAHHGIKGQKWGVRRFQNPDGTLTELGKRRMRERSEGDPFYSFNDEDKILKKGSLATRVIRESIEAKGRKDIYISAGKNDADSYVKWISDASYDNPDDVKVRTFKMKKNVAVASDKKVWDNIIKEIGNTKLSDLKKEKWDEDQYNIFSDYIDRVSGSLSNKYRKALNKYLEATTLQEAIEYNKEYGHSSNKSKIFSKNKFIDDLANIGYRASEYAALSFTLNRNDLKKRTIDELQKKGYGALKDINDPDTELPMILFDAPNQVKEISTISVEEYNKKKKSLRGDSK